MTDPSLAPSTYVDSEHPAVMAFAAEHGVGLDPVEVAVSLYRAVRDGFRYDPYRLDLSERGLRASTVLANGYGWCVSKAALLAAVCRARGIPARLGYADVRNHLSTERLRQTMGTDVFMWHGYTELLTDGHWRKATPAFNVELCERFGLVPLEFDGRSDSIYHPFDRAGNRHMEYLRERGTFTDIPRDQMLADFHRHYPRLVNAGPGGAPADWEADVEAETGGGNGGGHAPE